MEVSAQLTALLFPTPDTGALCGISYGERLDAIELPSWMDATSRHGRVKLDEGRIQSLQCTVREKDGRVEQVWVKLELADYQPPKELFKELSRLVSERIGNKGTRQETLWRIWWFDGPPRGSLAIHHDGCWLHVALTPRAGESLEASF